MYAVRRWSVRHSRGLETFYNGFESVLLWLEPVLRRVGYERLERPFAWLEEKVKGFLFDCQMCGQCVLSRTGMSCPMNCPKQLRNGPCGGVRANGNCEVKPDMKCVWVEAWNGSSRMRDGGRIHEVEVAVDRQLEGSSSWLRVVRIKTEEKRQERENEEQAA
ncbi:methylenetetrahydrofolate reductase C-terminal domain-containing protein [Halofilum ochraceum]|uniref:methylenetetrahydrofolate reductase C-terminal domain-containing protein n=1 Tax=Halofilum ochraceum TaxID=1611323 RepID=UPI0008DA7CD2|nr:methylenetetrahydrofolate reductase C-terminal domain-containing protein [Halofilum ochraceum]